MDMLAEAFETYVRKDLRKKINPFDIKEMDYIEASRLVIEEQSKKYTKRSGQKGVSNRINKKSR